MMRRLVAVLSRGALFAVPAALLFVGALVVKQRWFEQGVIDFSHPLDHESTWDSSETTTEEVSL